MASPIMASSTRGPARKLRASTATPTAFSSRPDAIPAMTGACVRLVMKPRRSTSFVRAWHPASSAAAPAPTRSSRRENKRLIPRLSFQASLALRDVWIPHSVLAVPAHRPARSSSPSGTGCVQGQQPMER